MGLRMWPGRQNTGLACAALGLIPASHTTGMAAEACIPALERLEILRHPWLHEEREGPGAQFSALSGLSQLITQPYTCSPSERDSQTAGAPNRRTHPVINPCSVIAQQLLAWPALEHEVGSGPGSSSLSRNPIPSLESPWSL